MTLEESTFLIQDEFVELSVNAFVNDAKLAHQRGAQGLHSGIPARKQRDAVGVHLTAVAHRGVDNGRGAAAKRGIFIGVVQLARVVVAERDADGADGRATGQNRTVGELLYRCGATVCERSL